MAAYDVTALPALLPVHFIRAEVVTLILQMQPAFWTRTALPHCKATWKRQPAERPRKKKEFVRKGMS